MEYTVAQKAAIETKGNSLLVSAAAGAGKTAVLVERVIQKICDLKDPVDIDKMLIVTFTNAAAAELRQRLTTALRKKVRENPDEPLYQRQLKLIGRAQISTVHAACKTLIDRFFTHLEIEPSVSIGEESEMELLFQSTLDEFVDELYEKRARDADTEALLQFFSAGRNDDSLRSVLRAAHDFLTAQPFPTQATEEMLPKVKDTLRECFEGDALFRLVEQTLRHAAEKARESAKQCNAGHMRGTPLHRYFNEISFYFETILQRFDQQGYEAANVYVQGEKTPKMPYFTQKMYREYCDGAQSDGCEPISAGSFEEEMNEKREEWKPYLAQFKSLVEKIFTQSEEAHLQDMKLLRKMVSLLFDGAFALDRRFSERKKEKNVVSFADLERYALRLLVTRDAQGDPVSSDLAKEIGGQYAEIIIDEYQDTNLLQDMIFAALSKDGSNLFMVGDIKQSIYRFRGACPHLFLEKMKECPEIFESATLDSPSKLFLNQNFRSHPAVLSAINDLFEEIMTESVGQVTYDEQQKLNPSDLYEASDASHCEMHLLLRPSLLEIEDNKEIALLKALEQEAMFVAEEIQNIVGKEDFYDVKKGCYRKVEYGDIAILSRSVQHVTSYFEGELAKLGIPCTNQNKDDNFLESWEIQMVLSYLKVLNNPYQDLPLVTLMYSDFFSFSANELAEIRALKKHVPFYEAVLLAAANDIKVQNFVSTLDTLREASIGMHAYELVARIYSESGILYKIAAYPDGRVRVSNMELLLQYARDFEKNTYKGLFAFLGYIDRLLAEEFRLNGAAGENEASSVQIMSIHKSKGLEFPVCFLVNTERDILGRGMREDILFTDIGAACKIRDSKHFAEYEPLLLTVAKQRELQQDLSEAMRLLYVALTRAKVKLYIVAALSTEQAEKMMRAAAAQGENSPLSPLVLQQDPSFLQWMVYGWRKGEGLQELYREFGVTPPTPKRGFVSAKLHKPKQKDYTKAAQNTIDADGAVIERVMQLIKQRYAFEIETNIPAKMSVSEVKGMREKDPEALPLLEQKYYARVPRFISATKEDGRESGNAVHKFMQFADFFALAEPNGIVKESDRLLRQDFFLASEMEKVNRQMIADFVAHPIFAELLSAQHLVKEQRFMFALPADKLLQGVDSGKEILLQGVLDCMYCKDGKWTILDYKTDRMKNEEDFAERYGIQLALYAEAAKQQWGIKIDRLLIYSFTLNKIIEIDTKKTLAF